MSFSNQPLIIAGRSFGSRLIVGTGKFSSPESMRDALAASGTELVTVALRRADLSGQKDPFASILEFIDPKKYLLLPNTSGAMNASEAVRLARLAVAAGLPKWVKLEIHPDPRYLLPDPVETLAAAELLVKEGFTVLPYINADPVLAKRLQDVGTATVMPLGSPIGSNRGLVTRAQLAIIIEQATVPVVVDAGLGAPSHAAEAMELGADAVELHTGRFCLGMQGALGVLKTELSGLRTGRASTHLLDPIHVEEPTMSVVFSANTSPLVGQEGATLTFAVRGDINLVVNRAIIDRKLADVNALGPLFLMLKERDLEENASEGEYLTTLVRRIADGRWFVQGGMW